MGYLGSIVTFEVVNDEGAEQTDERALTITLEDSKATVAGWSALGEYIIAGHEDGSVSQWDGRTGEFIYRSDAHEGQIQDLQFSPDRTYFITASKDKTAKLFDAKSLELLKTYTTDTPLNSAAITPEKEFVILGGGQAAMDVTTTAARQGKFEARIYHKIFEEEVGRVRGHFGPLNTVAVHPEGKGYCSGGEDVSTAVLDNEYDVTDFIRRVTFVCTTSTSRTLTSNILRRETSSGKASYEEMYVLADENQIHAKHGKALSICARKQGKHLEMSNDWARAI